MKSKLTAIKPVRVAALALPGDILRIKREALGLTREQLAPLVGVAARTLWRWEMGRGRYGSAGWPKAEAFAEMIGKMRTLAKSRGKRQTLTVTV